MRQNIPLVRIAGVPVGFNWSLLVVFGLLTWTFATYRFPAEFPDRSELVYWVAGVITTFAFFSCLLAHEMAHAVVARRLRVRVEGITLWLFGGIARIRGDDMNARSELRIAVAGPLTSLLIGGLFLGAGYVLSNLGTTESVGTVVSWLGWINVTLALFNLIPAFPMDGGRIMRSLLWRRLGRARATSIAVRTGRGFAFLLMGVGLVEASVGNAGGGLWLVFLGWFLSNAAQAEEQPASARRSLGNVRVEDIMTRSPITAPAWMTVDAFLEFAGHQPNVEYPLREIDGSTTGMASAARVARAVPRNRDTTRVRDVACRIHDVAVARPDELLEHVLARPVRCGHGWILVLNDGGLAGVVTPSDLERGMDLHEQAAARSRAG